MIRYPVLLGALFWVLVALGFVVLRGAAPDENREFARLLLGWDVYPTGHPLSIYAHSAFSGQTWLDLLLRAAFGDRLWIDGLHGAALLALALLPAYLLAARLGGAARWGHATALFVLESTLLEFDGSYPAAVWPQFYSNGPVGTGYALLCVWAVAGAHWRTAALLAGFLPLVHLGQAPPVFLLGLGVLGWLVARGDYAAIRRAAPWALPGALLSVALFAWLRLHAPELPAQGPYAVAGDADALWRAYTFGMDPHRRPPDAMGHVALAGLLLLAYRAWRTERGFAAGVLLAYGLVVAALVWGTLALHTALGEATPPALLVWMPYRLLNHAAPLALALAVALVARMRHGALVLGIVLAALALRPVYGAWLPEALYRRYLFGGELYVFFLAGVAWLGVAACPFAVGRGPTRAMLTTLLRFGGPVLPLAFVHQPGAVTFALGALLGRVLPEWRARELPVWSVRLGVALAAAAMLLPHAYFQFVPLAQRAPLVDAHTAAYIDTHAPPEALLLGPPDALGLQARFEAPVLCDATTASYLSYVPALGPAIDRLLFDAYGHGIVTRGDAAWERVWRARGLGEWQAFAARYQVAWVYWPGAPADCVLASTEIPALYRIPGVTSPRERR